MEPWRKTWRVGLAPQLSVQALAALRRGLQDNDSRLMQGATTTPLPIPGLADDVEAACSLGFGAWQGEGLQTVAAVEEFFARLCFEADECLGEPGAIRRYLNWYDDTPRDEMRRQLLAEVNRALAQRCATSGDPAAA